MGKAKTVVSEAEEVRSEAEHRYHTDPVLHARCHNAGLIINEHSKARNLFLRDRDLNLIHHAVAVAAVLEEREADAAG